eukprot:tig00000042_g15449.t1
MFAYMGGMSPRVCFTAELAARGLSGTVDIAHGSTGAFVVETTTPARDLDVDVSVHVAERDARSAAGVNESAPEPRARDGGGQPLSCQQAARRGEAAADGGSDAAAAAGDPSQRAAAAPEPEPADTSAAAPAASAAAAAAGDAHEPIVLRESDCAICCAPLRGRPIHVTECGHPFHAECLGVASQRQSEPRCPLCRAPLETRQAPLWDAPAGPTPAPAPAPAPDAARFLERLRLRQRNRDRGTRLQGTEEEEPSSAAERSGQPTRTPAEWERLLDRGRMVGPRTRDRLARSQISEEAAVQARAGEEAQESPREEELPPRSPAEAPSTPPGDSLPLSTPAGDTLTLTVTPEFSAIPLRISVPPCTIAATVTAAPLSPDDPRRPSLDLVAVIDVSGSMAGAPLQLVKRVLHFVVSALGPRDRFALVLFSGSARTVLHLTCMGEEGRRRAAAVVDAVHHDQQIARYAREALEGADPAARPTAPHIDTASLRPAATPSRPAFPPDLPSSRDRSVAAVHTFGFRASHDASLLRSLAEAGGGSFEYVSSGAEVAAAFGARLASLSTRVARSASLHIAARGGARVRRVHRTGAGEARPAGAEVEGGGYVLPLGDLAAEETRTGVITVDVVPPPGAAPGEALELLEVSLSYTDLLGAEAEGSARVVPPAVVRVQLAGPDEAPPPVPPPPPPERF